MRRTEESREREAGTGMIDLLRKQNGGLTRVVIHPPTMVSVTNQQDITGKEMAFLEKVPHFVTRSP